MATKSNSRAITNARADNDGDVPDWAKGTTGEESAPVTETVEGQVDKGTPALDALLAWCASKCEEKAIDSQAGMEMIVRQVLQSDSPADILREALPQSAQDYVGSTVLMHAFRVFESDLDDSKGWPYYVAIDVMAGDPPQARVLTTSSLRIVAQVAALDNIGEWPQLVKVTEMRAAKKGQSAPLGLVQVVAKD